MITGYLMSAIFGLLMYFLALLPLGGTMPTSITDAAENIGGAMYFWNTVLPVTELMQVISLTVLLTLGIFAVRSIMYVIALFRGNSMPGQ